MTHPADYIQRLISEGEHVHQDFKFEISDARKIAKSISAFANTEGGRLLVGVKDNGKIAGVRSEEEIYMWAYVRIKDENILASPIHLNIWQHNRHEEKVIIAYTQREQQVLNLLAQHPCLTLNQCQRLTRMNRKLITNLLADFIRFGLVEQVFHEHTFYFRLKE